MHGELARSRGERAQGVCALGVCASTRSEGGCAPGAVCVAYPPCPGSTELGVPSRDVCDVRVRSTCERTRVRGVPG